MLLFEIFIYLFLEYMYIYMYMCICICIMYVIVDCMGPKYIIKYNQLIGHPIILSLSMISS